MLVVGGTSCVVGLVGLVIVVGGMWCYASVQIYYIMNSISVIAIIAIIAIIAAHVVEKEWWKSVSC